MNFNDLSTRDINVLGSYWGILSHADCRNLWFKYTGVKKFEDLHVKVHERMFVREIIGKEITISGWILLVLPYTNGFITFPSIVDKTTNKIIVFTNNDGLITKAVMAATALFIIPPKYGIKLANIARHPSNTAFG